MKIDYIYEQVYVTGFAKTVPICTRTEIQFNVMIHSWTIQKHQYMAIDGQVCFIDSFCQPCKTELVYYRSCGATGIGEHIS